MKRKIIFLCGFMGSGKSTVGSLLARLLNCEFEDLDETICTQEGLSIPEIFSAKGEAAFRDAEGKALERVNLEGRRVIALGGGTLLNEKSRAYVMKNGLLIYLVADVQTISKRLERSANMRPLLAGLSPEQRKSKIEVLMNDRIQIYDTAPIRIITDDRLPLDIATDIARMITHDQAGSTKRDRNED